MDVPEKILRDGLRNTALEVRAINVDEADKPATLEFANQIESVADIEKPEDLVMSLMMTFSAGMMNETIPMIAKLAVGRVISELNIKLIEGIQAHGA